MTISELIDQLSTAKERFGDLPVMVTFEGVTRGFTLYRGRDWNEAPWSLLLDADEEFYRKTFEHPDDRPAVTAPSTDQSSKA